MARKYSGLRIAKEWHTVLWFFGAVMKSSSFHLNEQYHIFVRCALSCVL